MNSEDWFEYVKSSYDLVMESEGQTKIILEHEVEAYVVHLIAKNFNRLDIGEQPIAIKMLEAVQNGTKNDLLSVADECLLIDSFPLKKSKWPNKNYYKELGITAYGLAGHIMEKNFYPASKILFFVFNRKIQDLSLISLDFNK